MTSQAGVIPVIRFLDYIRLAPTCRKHIDLKRADNARYGLDDAIFLTVVGMIAGATSLMKVVSVWADSVLRRLVAGCPSQMTARLGGFFVWAAQACAQLEQVNHCLRQTVWQRALKSGIWLPGTLYRSWVDVDSTVKTVYGRQEGAERAITP